jgi:general secretion pathway protein H
MSRLKMKSRQQKVSGNNGHKLTDGMGFTLIELTVVMALISIMFVVALPRIKNDLIVDQTKKTSRWLLTSVRYLKESSIRDQMDYTLHVDMDNGKLWISHESMAENTLEQSETGGLTLSGGVRIVDVALAGNRKMTDGEAMIQFYAKGYSDNAMIHLVNEDDRALSFHISPFLLRLKMIEDYVDLEDS